MVFKGDIRDFEPEKKYGVILADPPWQYTHGVPGHGDVKDHYFTMENNDLYQLPVNEWSIENSLLILWATWPKLKVGIELIEKWGFVYKTGLPWVKMSTENKLSFQYGIGYWVRGCSEPILLATRGNVSPPKEKGFLGLLSPNLGHSRKPHSIYEIAEALPGPYLELFARRSREGWDSVGNECIKDSLPLFDNG